MLRRFFAADAAVAVLAVLALGFGSGRAAAAAEGSAKRPNVVFFLSDDHTTQAISCYGSQLTATPNIDRFAAGGVRFDRCFCTESICGPSRAAIMTGKYGHVTGAMGWEPYDRRHRTFPEYLQGAGYQTALIGKYHLGDNPPGFDHFDILPGQGRYRDPVLVSKAGSQVRRGHVSDVQGFLLGEHGLFDQRWMYEECLRLPLVVRYPPLAKAGAESRETVAALQAELGRLRKELGDLAPAGK